MLAGSTKDYENHQSRLVEDFKRQYPKLFEGKGGRRGDGVRVVVDWMPREAPRK